MNELEVRPPRPAESAQIVTLLTAGESEMRRHLITSSVAGALKNPDAKTVGLVAACGDQMRGAVIGSALPGGTGVLVGLRIATEEQDELTPEAAAEVAAPLFQALTAYLHALDVRFIQSTCDTQSPPAELMAVGFQHLADLQYLSVEASALNAQVSPELTFVDATELSEEQIVELVEQTYIDTRDCPSMNQYRIASETLASYRAMPQHDPTAWRIAQHKGEAIGCVLTLPFVDSNALELTYMGVVPSARGNRWGASLVSEAGRIAQQRGLQTVNLGVDQKNDPAQQIYERFGFTSFFGESVWGRRID
ncbi:GNAT family N-acetyltransferase [Rosistilla ulvae]|uniref:GNAT family N-acetyltransferase n=1 Tax=Rosistilla ulvae TaxID=1930277 RepID=UPI001C54DD82|nr:GNAT family N-acetyltransferase [Rosistilla ulvae]